MQNAPFLKNYVKYGKINAYKLSTITTKNDDLCRLK